MRFFYRSRIRLLIAVAAGLSLAACHQGPTSASGTAASALNQSVDDVLQKGSGSSAQPPRSDASAQTKSFIALMQALPAKEQTQARHWYERMRAPTVDTATPDQIAWMTTRGYPMPADIARAVRMSEAELKAAASTGNATARTLYVARLLDQFNVTVVSSVPHNNNRRTNLLIEITQAMREALASGSPYAGYLYAARARLMYPDNTNSNAAAQLAGLVWASKFGDNRANRHMNAPTVQAVDATTAASAMGLMLVIAMNTNPRLFSTPVVTIPSS